MLYSIGMAQKTNKNRLPFDIVYEDRDMIVVYKKSGLLTIATDDGDLHNLYHYVREYVNRKKQKIFIVHRLDKATSGLLIFAKNMETKRMLQSSFEDRSVIRKYEAIVREQLPLDYEKKVVQYLSYDHRSGRVFVTKDKKKGEEAITYLKANNPVRNGTALDISIKTGRQNQIRIALHSLGLTLVGDKKYALDEENRMMLNAYELDFPETLRMREHHFALKPFWLE